MVSACPTTPAWIGFVPALLASLFGAFLGIVGTLAGSEWNRRRTESADRAAADARLVAACEVLESVLRANQEWMQGIVDALPRVALTLFPTMDTTAWTTLDAEFLECGEPDLLQALGFHFSKLQLVLLRLEQLIERQTSSSWIFDPARDEHIINGLREAVGQGTRHLLAESKTLEQRVRDLRLRKQ